MATSNAPSINPAGRGVAAVLAELGIEAVNSGAFDGTWRATAGERLDSFDPTTGELIASVTQATAADYEAVAAASVKAFEAWREWPAPKRGEVIRQLGDELRRYKEPLGKLVSIETGKIYSEGLGRFITLLIGDSPEHRLVATTFGAMALSTFIFDTLDSATRLGRYVLQELFGAEGRVAALLATAVTCAVPLLFLTIGKRGSFQMFWTLFGTSNQLLASLSLLAISVWLYRGGGGRRGQVPWFTLVPMGLILAVTVTSLVLQARPLFTAALGSTPWINGVVAVTLLSLATVLLGYGVAAVRRTAAEPA